MSSEELKSVLREIANAPPLPAGATMAEARVAVEHVMSGYPVATDLSFEKAFAGGLSGLWARPPATGDAVILYLHGGGYILGSAWGFRGVAGEIGRAAMASVFAPDYRLAPEHPFPAALDDALLAWQWLLNQGINPDQMAIAGDSAGGGLAVSSLLSIRDAGLPMPRAALLISPWVDLQMTGASMTSKARVDPILRLGTLTTMALAYLGGVSASSALASPLHNDLVGLPPLLIQVGSAEILLDDATRLATLAGAADVDVTLQIWPHMFHGWQSRAYALAEGREAICAGGDFMRQRLYNVSN